MSSDNSPEMITIGQAATILSREFPDVSVSSLRFLEREGLLSPQRKPGGHRLYGPADMERARRIKQWQAERIPLKEIRMRLERAPHLDQISGVVAEMTSLLLSANDLDSAMELLNDVYQAGTPMLTICNDVLTPVLRNLGDDRGNHLIPVDVQLELDERLVMFFSRVTVRPENVAGKPVIVAACPPWERHDMPLRMLAALLTERGAAVHFIGAQVDGEFVRDAITRLRPDSILISLTVRPPGKAVAWFNDLVSILEPHQRLVIGGLGSTYLPKFDAPNVSVQGMLPYAETTDLLMSEAVSGTSEG